MTSVSFHLLFSILFQKWKQNSFPVSQFPTKRKTKNNKNIKEDTSSPITEKKREKKWKLQWTKTETTDSMHRSFPNQKRVGCGRKFRQPFRCVCVCVYVVSCTVLDFYIPIHCWPTCWVSVSVCRIGCVFLLTIILFFLFILFYSLFSIAFLITLPASPSHAPRNGIWCL